MFGGSFSILHWIVVLAVVLLLFGGRGKVSAIMGDFGKGLRNFKTGLKGPDSDNAENDEDEEGDEGVSASNTKPTIKKKPRKKSTTQKKAPAKKKAASKKASTKR